MPINHEDIDLSDRDLNAKRIGRILRAYREKNGMTLRDICSILDYKYTNFISALEMGNSTIPIARLGDVCNAYQLPSIFIPIVIKYVHEGSWDAIKVAMITNKKLFKSCNPETIDADLEKALKDMLIEEEILKIME